MDILENLYKINEHLNKNSGIYSHFEMNRIDGYDYSIDYKYYYYDRVNEKDINVEIKNIYKTKDKKIITNYVDLDKSRFIANEIGYNTLFEIEKIILDFNKIDNEKKTENLYILKANYSHSVLMEEKTEYSKIYDLHNIYGDLDSKYNFLFTLEEVKNIEKNPNIIFDCYIVKVSDVLEEYNEKTYNEESMYKFSNNLVINQELFEEEESADYYNTVLRIKRMVSKSVDDFKNRLDWVDNMLFINKLFILDFYETHIGFDLNNISNTKLQGDLFGVIEAYNECPHKVASKYVVIDKTNNWFLQSKKTPIGEIIINPLKPQHIREFDEYCIFYLEEITEKFSTDMLAELYSHNSKYEIILWEKIDDYRELLFSEVSDKEYKTIINNINSISKRVV